MLVRRTQTPRSASLTFQVDRRVQGKIQRRDIDSVVLDATVLPGYSTTPASSKGKHRCRVRGLAAWTYQGHGVHLAPWQESYNPYIQQYMVLWCFCSKKQAGLYPHIFPSHHFSKTFVFQNTKRDTIPRAFNSCFPPTRRCTSTQMCALRVFSRLDRALFLGLAQPLLCTGALFHRAQIGQIVDSYIMI